MDEKQKQIEDLKQKIQTAENDLEAAKRALFELTGEGGVSGGGMAPMDQTNTENGEIIEGDFNGENMVGPGGKVYPVPANYASKSKLVEGDRLKLTIAEDGTFLFKQIQPVDRERVIGELVFSDNAYHAKYNNKEYSVLYASVTYHKAKPGDRVAIVIPKGGNSSWAVLENVIHNEEDEAKFAAEQEQGGEATSGVAVDPVIPVAEEASPAVQEDQPVSSATEPVVPPAESLAPTEEKKSVLDAGDIEIEAPKPPAPQSQEPMPEVAPPQTEPVHPLEEQAKAAEQAATEEAQPVQEMEI